MLQTVFGWRSIFFTLVAAGLAGAAIVWLLLPETLNAARRRAGIAGHACSRPIALWRAIRPISLISGIASASYAGLFAWISGSSFVLQYLYGLTPFDFGVAFAVGSVGYMTGTTLAARLVMRLGLDRTLGFGAAAWRPAGSAWCWRSRSG